MISVSYINMSIWTYERWLAVRPPSLQSRSLCTKSPYIATPPGLGMLPSHTSPLCAPRVWGLHWAATLVKILLCMFAFRRGHVVIGWSSGGLDGTLGGHLPPRGLTLSPIPVSLFSVAKVPYWGSDSLIKVFRVCGLDGLLWSRPLAHDFKLVTKDRKWNWKGWG